jgi:hypothetical protein
MSTLDTIGVQTVHVLTGDASALVIEAESGFPEFKPGAYPKVLGGFAAYGNPSSFHCPLVKMLREATFKAVKKSRVFQKYLESARPTTCWNYRLEMLFDRLMHRFSSQSPSAETAHRDIIPPKYLTESDDDQLFGGWLNLTDKPQHFVYQPGSQVRNSYEAGMNDSTGFAKLDPKSEEYLAYQASKQTFEVPPGHLVIFHQHLIHEVLSKKTEHDQFRLFFGWRVTKGLTPLFPNKETIIDTLGVPEEPSGQKPPMFSSNHQSLFKNTPFYWRGDAYPNEYGTLEDWWVATLNVPMKRRLGPLIDYYPDYPKYTPSEKKLMMTMHRLDV